MGRYSLAADFHLNPRAVTAASISQNSLWRLSELVPGYLFPAALHSVSCTVTEPVTGCSNTSESMPFPMLL